MLEYTGPNNVQFVLNARAGGSPSPSARSDVLPILEAIPRFQENEIPVTLKGTSSERTRFCLLRVEH